MEDTLAHPFPMIRAAGAFLMVSGVFFAFGWISPKLFGLFMSLAFGVGFMAAYTALQLAPDLGPVRWLDVIALGFAFFIEIVALVWMYRVVKDERRADAWVLILVGLHFIPMAVLMGPSALILAAVTTLNGILALRFTAASILPFGLIDSGVKIALGAWIFFAMPTFGAGLNLDGLGLGTL
jgi:hypothetical protein